MGNIHRKKKKERLRGRRMAEEAWKAAERSDWGEAEKTLRNALKHREGDCVLWHDLALILWKRGELKESERCLRTALLLRPDYEDGKMSLAALLASRGFYRQAHRLTEDLARSSPRAEFHQKKLEEYAAMAEAVSREHWDAECSSDDRGKDAEGTQSGP